MKKPNKMQCVPSEDSDQFVWSVSSPCTQNSSRDEVVRVLVIILLVTRSTHIFLSANRLRLTANQSLYSHTNLAHISRSAVNLHVGK